MQPHHATRIRKKKCIWNLSESIWNLLNPPVTSIFERLASLTSGWVPTGIVRSTILQYIICPYGGFLSHGGTPSSHPFYFRLFHYKPSIWGYHHLWKPPYIYILYISYTVYDIYIIYTYIYIVIYIIIYKYIYWHIMYIIYIHKFVFSSSSELCSDPLIMAPLPLPAAVWAPLPYLVAGWRDPTRGPQVALPIQGAMVEVSINGGTPLSLDGWFIVENPKIKRMRTGTPMTKRKPPYPSLIQQKPSCLSWGLAILIWGMWCFLPPGDRPRSGSAIINWFLQVKPFKHFKGHAWIVKTSKAGWKHLGTDMNIKGFDVSLVSLNLSETYLNSLPSGYLTVCHGIDGP